MKRFYAVIVSCLIMGCASAVITHHDPDEISGNVYRYSRRLKRLRRICGEMSNEKKIKIR